MIYKTFQKVSNVCQLLKPNFLTNKTSAGVTCTSNGNTFTLNGTSSGETSISVPIYYITSKGVGHKFLISGCPQGAWSSYSIFFGALNQGLAARDYGNGAIFTSTTAGNYVGVAIKKAGITFDNLIFKPQLFDLTEMYGAGNEPTTVEQFRQDFPEEMYDYRPHCFVKSYKTLLKVSNVCQVLDKSKYPATTTKEGITWTNNGDGTITANGTATALTNILVDTVTPTIIKSGHKFLILGCPLSNGNITTSKEYWMQEGYEFCSDHGVGGFFSLKGNNINLRVYIQKDYTADNLTFKPQIFDLTEMYGAGHEPTTVEEFRQDFPNDLYDYKPYSIIPSYKKSLVCKTKNLFDIDYAYKTCERNFKTFSVSSNSITGTITNLYSGVVYAIKLYSGSLPAGSYCFSALLSTENTPLNCRPSELLIYRDGSLINLFRYPSDGDRLINFTFNFSSSGECVISFYRNILSIPTENLSDSVYGFTFSNIQLELGNTATDYVPYGHL